MSLTKAKVEEFFAYLKSHGIMPTLEKYYAADARMSEAGLPETVGFENLKKSEGAFADMLKPKAGMFLDIKIHNIVVSDNIAAVEHTLVMSFGEGNVEEQLQVALQHWKDGKIVKETFYHVKKE